MQKTVIEPKGKNGQYFKDLWRYRGLALNFAKRDIRVRYKQTAIGIGWALIGPLINMLLMSFIFGNLAKLPADGQAPYPIMVYSGLIAWNLFARSLTVGASAFSTNADLMKKVYFPRLAAPLGQALAVLADSLISFLILFLLFALTGYSPPMARLPLGPVALLLPLLLGFFAGIFLAPWSVRRKDLNHALPFLLQMGQYLSPVVYSFALISANFSPRMALLYSLNPMTGSLNAFKWCLIGELDFHLPSFIISLAWLTFLIPAGLYRFRKAERNFVDLI